MSEVKKSNYFLVYRNSCRELAKYCPEEMAQRSGALYDEDKKEFTLTYLNKQYLISYPEGNIALKDSGGDTLSDSDRIMIIHYLYQASNSPLTSRWVTYRELKGSGAYYSAFVRYGTTPLAGFFGDKVDAFLKAGAKLGGKPYPYGDAGLVFDVFPKIPIALVLWTKDEEFEASANILFDYSAPLEIHIEDLAALGPRLVEEMIKAARNM